ncbi:alpha-glucosidase [Fontibacillus solani]|uniref:Alpha-glucosidase n=1 Tax=Fontibacillus solani TaxID=1572857 RepID=A0A7W3SQY7_9BACL|nr:TIM-barrel domain-containing protein [Fontibacillus solani]MBA9084640.1 alpha-glucosidase [Fontibacillus solani]
MQGWIKKKPVLVGLTLVCAIVIIILVIVFANNGNSNKEQAEPSATKAEESVINGEGQGAATTGQDYLEMKSDTNVIRIDVIRPDAIRVQVNPNGVAEPDTLIIANRDFDPVGATIDVSSNPAVITTDQMKVVVDTAKYSMTVYDHNDKLLIEQPDLLVGLNGQIEFTHDAKDSMYGISGYDATEGSDDGIILGDTEIVSGGKQGHPGAPLVWSSAGYGMLVDTINARYYNDNGKVSFKNLSKPSAHYYVMVGNPTSIMSTVSAISGTSPLFPKWSLGFMNTEWGIDEKELLQHVNTYREKQIPIDSFSLDFDWKAWSEDNYGEFRWNDKKFPSGSSGKLKETLDSKGIKLTGIFKPRIHVKTEQGKYATEHGFWWPNKKNYLDYFSKQPVNDLNFELPEVRTWYFDNIKKAFDTGIIGYWNDEADEGYTTEQFINMQKGLYEGQREYSDQRVWSVNRSFYLGAQKYAYGLWSGDIGSGFQVMANQRERMLTAINVGEVKWGMDIGGFQSDPEPENYARWMQFGAFTPIYRVHGKENMQRQPWYFGEKAEAAATEAIKLRYQLIPYIYSYEEKAYNTGIGLVKPLVYDYPDDPNTQNLVDSWMFGDWLLVSPVVSQEATKSIYLPQGEWIDYFSGKVYTGGQTIAHKVDLENWSDIPLFIKKGAIIPTAPVMNYIGEKPVDVVTVDAFPSPSETGFDYYDDDGATYGYENGQFFKQHFSVVEESAGKYRFSTAAPLGTYTPEAKYYLIKLHGAAGSLVTSNGADMSKVQDLSQLNQLSGEGWTTGKDQYGEVTYVKVKTGVSLSINVTK